LKYPPFPGAQNFQDGVHQTTEIFEKGTIFFGHPVHWAIGKFKDTKDASDNGAFVENQTRFLVA
jgi:hypothetical protein